MTQPAEEGGFLIPNTFPPKGGEATALGPCVDFRGKGAGRKGGMKSLCASLNVPFVAKRSVGGEGGAFLGRPSKLTYRRCARLLERGGRRSSLLCICGGEKGGKRWDLLLHLREESKSVHSNPFS